MMAVCPRSDVADCLLKRSIVASAPSTPNYGPGLGPDGIYRNKDSSPYTGPVGPDGMPSATNAELVALDLLTIQSDRFPTAALHGSCLCLRTETVLLTAVCLRLHVAKYANFFACAGPVNEDGTPSKVNDE